MSTLNNNYITKLNRYELKYVIPKELIEPLTRYLLTYCNLDEHTSESEDLFYSINTLYFDTPNFTFLKNRLYTKNPRFNMRARSYGFNPTPPYFLEIKYKDGNSVRKYRSKVDEYEWQNMFSNPEYRTHLQGEEGEMKNKELFYKTAIKYLAEPKIFTQYRRRAFVSKYNEYARVTMDIDMHCYLEDKYNLKPEIEKLIPYDNESVYAKEPDRVDGANVVLELKCYPNQVPIWMIDMIREFELVRTSFSKYMRSILTIKEFDMFHNIYFNFNDRKSKILNY